MRRHTPHLYDAPSYAIIPGTIFQKMEAYHDPNADSTRGKLKTVSVATLTTALFKRGLRNQFIQDVHPLNPNAGNMVGEAFTLRYIPAREGSAISPRGGRRTSGDAIVVQCVSRYAGRTRRTGVSDARK